MKDASLPITLIIVGLVWLIWHFRFFPDVDWVIALGFIAGGVAVMVIDGINKNSIVIGPILIAMGVAWWLNDRYRTQLVADHPALLVLLGVLMLVARNPGSASTAPRLAEVD